MNEKIFIGVAWPYANGSLHLGHITGCYLPADIFARYNRMKGNNVLMVSGSDEHGTPITLTAEKECTTPQSIVDRYHKEHKENMKQFGISFDLFTRTTTANHKKVVQDIFIKLYKNNYINEQRVEAFYCENCTRFLPDRYIEGSCPHCGNENARGDQCDECSKMLDPLDLLNVKCKMCGGKPVVKTTNHLFFKLSQFESKLSDWLKDKQYWRSSVLKFTQNWLKTGLNDRAITRDITWGIEVPLQGFEDKRIYVWFDAVIGYLSASKEWAKKQGKTSVWENWWKNKNAKHYYFLAKDNIPFHSLIWPSILIGYDSKLNLPYDIPANEYLRLKGEQFSKSRGLAVWVPDIIANFDVDAVRYYLSINMPEHKDTNWTWEDFVTKNNNELVGAYGNFVHRVFTFTAKNFGEIPKKGKFDKLDKMAHKKIEETYKKVGDFIDSCNFKKGLRTAMDLAQFGNYYFDQKQPWILVKTNKEKCTTTVYICLRIVKALAIFLAPFLPFSSEVTWRLLGYNKSVHSQRWEHALEDNLNEGTVLVRPQPLFKKLRLTDIMGEKIELFSKLDLRVAKIVDVKNHPKADKLYLLQVDLGDLGKRVLVAGIKPYYKAEELYGRYIVIVANLKPALIRGIESKGMLLAADDEQSIVSLLNPGDARPGSEVFIEGISQEPIPILEFDVFKTVNMVIGDNLEATYNGLPIMSEKGIVVSDKPVKKGTKIH